MTISFFSSGVGLPPTFHHLTHENTGADEISVAGLSGLLADDQHVLDAEVLAVASDLHHHLRHEDGSGTDEMSVAGLSGHLADLQDPNLTQGADAAKGAAGTAGRVYWATDTKILYRDTGAAWVEVLRGETVSRLASLAEKSHVSLTNVTADQHHAQAHTLTSHSTKDHGELTNVTSGQHHAQLHHASHEVGGGDLLSAIGLGLLQTGNDAAKPAAGVAGRIYWATDTKILYRDTGAAWVEVLRGLIGTAQIASGAVTRGAHYFSNVAVHFDSTTEVQIGTMTIYTNEVTDSVWIWASITPIVWPDGTSVKGGRGNIYLKIRRDSLTGTLLASIVLTPLSSSVDYIGLPPAILIASDIPGGAVGAHIYKISVATDVMVVGHTDGQVNYVQTMGLAKSR
jgi:hypothetical protein